MRQVQIQNIVPSKTNPRKGFDKQKMKELEESIREKGILQPILVRPYHANYQIVCGERRYRAALAVGLKEIPT
jgi:ParB family chromosome partitioning protein